MKKIKITFYMTLEEYALLSALRIKLLLDGRLPTQTEVINNAIRILSEALDERVS